MSYFSTIDKCDFTVFISINDLSESWPCFTFKRVKESSRIFLEGQRVPAPYQCNISSLRNAGLVLEGLCALSGRGYGL